MAIELREYQNDFIKDLRGQFQKYNRVCGVAPCGAGKTIVAGWIIRNNSAKGQRSIFMVHRKELIEQTSAAFTALGIEHGIISAQCPPQLELPVQIASVQTLTRRLNKIPKPDFIICDECHHILANTYMKIVEAFPDAKLLGLTATPQRMGGVRLGKVFDSLVETLSVNELIEMGNLTPFKYFATANFKLKNVRTKFGEYVQSDLSRFMQQATITGDIVRDYQTYAHGLQAICYCVDVAHSKRVAREFNLRGVKACHVDGDTPKAKRAALVEDFRQKKIQVMCNVELFGEGFDVPNCQAVILARPTKSLTLYIQQSLRALRPDPNDPNKIARIIDHVNNVSRHGLPNENHHWTLEPNVEQIFARYKQNEEYHPRHSDTLDGKLLEIEVDFTDKKKSDEKIKTKPTTIEEFLIIAEERRYKKYWAAMQAVKFAGSEKDCRHIGEVCGYKRGWEHYAWKGELVRRQNLR